jgi:hypothetical protein
VFEPLPRSAILAALPIAFPCLAELVVEACKVGCGCPKNDVEHGISHEGLHSSLRILVAHLVYQRFAGDSTPAPGPRRTVRARRGIVLHFAQDRREDTLLVSRQLVLGGEELLFDIFDERGPIEFAALVELLYLEELYYFPEYRTLHPDITLDYLCRL